MGRTKPLCRKCDNPHYPTELAKKTGLCPACRKLETLHAQQHSGIRMHAKRVRFIPRLIVFHSMWYEGQWFVGYSGLGRRKAGTYGPHATLADAWAANGLSVLTPYDWIQ